MTFKYLSLWLAFLLLFSGAKGQSFEPVDPRPYEDMSFLSTNPFRKLVTTNKGGTVAQPPPGNYVLVGVVARDDRDVAYLRDKKNGSVFKVEKGEEINGVTLLNVENGRINQETFVTVRSAGREFEVFFDMDSPRPKAPTPPKSQRGDKGKTGKKPEKPKGDRPNQPLKVDSEGNGVLRLNR